ncbi:putative nucleic acid-binding Zn-ribbon protein [Bradyrhizobium elkanii]|uniref:hypothetical protein n=1 Tax=Bradyrhizobium elkanii TaxID=29448 RepID=UPI0015C3C1E0|nr:hypothetical protein [Bradyrhizobium elkanii]NWL42592.1 hypothetical protein [Bradyrhizobium elkanii]
MSPKIRRLEGLRGTVASTAEVIGLPFREVRWKIAQAKAACELLRQSIATVRQRLKALEDRVGQVADIEAREILRHQLETMNEELQRGLDKLSDIEKLLEDVLRRTHRTRG